LQLRLPILGAHNERQALDQLHALGVPVPLVVGYGENGGGPAHKRSFILMEEVAPTISLEDLAKIWIKSPPSAAFKRKIILEVARIARILHQHGMNHRDFYLCHFLLDTSDRPGLIDKGGTVKLYLIDLHRAQIRRLTPRRWAIKDLSGLYFSSKDAGLTQHDVFRFMKAYAGKPLRALLGKDGPHLGADQSGLHLDETFWQKVKARGERLYSDHTKRT
jgi:heptose I phosphotransferase